VYRGEEVEEEASFLLGEQQEVVEGGW